MLGYGVNFDVPSDAATSSSDKFLSWRDNKQTTAKRPPLRALEPRPQSSTASQTDVRASDQHIPWFPAPRDWHGAIPALPPSPQCPTASQPRLHPSDQHIQWSLDPRDQYGATYQFSSQLQPPLPYQPASAQALHHQPSPNQQYQPFYLHQGASRHPPMPTSTTYFRPSLPPVYGPGPQLLQQQQVCQHPQNACSAKRSRLPPLHKPATHACWSNSAASRAQLDEENSSRPIASVLSTQGKAGLSPGLKSLDVSLAAGTSKLPAQSAMQPSTPNAPHRPRLGTLSQKHSLSNQEDQATQSAGHTQTKSPGATTQATRPQASAISRGKTPHSQHDRLQAPPVPQFSLPAPRAITTGAPKPHEHFPDQQLLSTQQNPPLPRPLSLSPSEPKCISTDSERDRDTLGVDESATQEEYVSPPHPNPLTRVANQVAVRIRAAYWKREFEYHPARHRGATPEVQARVAEKLAKAQAAVDRLKGFDGVTWGAWESLEEYSNPFGLGGVNKSG